MLNEHIPVNIRKAISLIVTKLGIFRNLSVRRAMAASAKTVNKPLDCPPHFTCIKLISVLHKTVSAVMAVLDTSRPRGLRLARKISSRAIFVGVLLILTSLFTLEGVAQNTPPGAPTGLTGTSGDGQVSLSWTAPSNTGSHTITHYQYAYTSLRHSSPDWESTGSSDASYVVKGLKNQIVYRISIRAVSGGGTGGDINDTFTPNIDAPTNLAATAGDGEVTLSWTAVPASDWTTPQSSDTYYQYNQNDGTDWTKIPNSTKTTATYIVTGLTKGTSYTFRVRAHGAGGGGEQSDSQTETTLSLPDAPTNLAAVVGNGRVRLTWTAPAGPIIRYEYNQDGGAWTSTGSGNTTYTVTNLSNGTTYTFRVRGVNSDGNGAASTSVTARPQLPNPPDAPTGLAATPGNGQVTLSWTAPTIFVTHYEYSQDDGTWTSTGGFSTTLTITNLTNGIAYTFRVRGVNSAGNGAASTSVTATPLRDAPNSVNLQVEMVPAEDKKTARAILTWNPPSNARNAEGETLGYEYRYKSNPWTPWTSTGSSETTHTVTGLEFGKEYTFQIRAFYVREGGNPHYIYTSPPSTSSSSVTITLQPATSRRFECPVGWTRGSIFGETKKAIIYELKVNVDLTNTISMYQLKSLAIYVHPEENLETLEGWYLTTGILYNHDHENKFQLTAENAIIDEHGFAHIENPEAIPIRMGTLGFIGQSLPSFDYRLYDERGARVDFGISCYKEGGLTWRLWNTEDPRVLRVLPFPISDADLSVRMKELDWQTPFFRTQWTAAIMPDLPDAPAAPSLVKKNIVGTWADLKKQ